MGIGDRSDGMTPSMRELGSSRTSSSDLADDARHLVALDHALGLGGRGLRVHRIFLIAFLLRVICFELAGMADRNAQSMIAFSRTGRDGP